MQLAYHSRGMITKRGLAPPCDGDAMTTAIIWNNNTGRGDINVSSAGLRQDDGLETLVLQILFTDARADESDVLPDGTNDRRGWPGDTFADEPNSHRRQRYASNPPNALFENAAGQPLIATQP